MPMTGWRQNRRPAAATSREVAAGFREIGNFVVEENRDIAPPVADVKAVAKFRSGRGRHYRRVTHRYRKMMAAREMFYKQFPSQKYQSCTMVFRP
jgi:hypothetical protein